VRHWTPPASIRPGRVEPSAGVLRGGRLVPGTADEVLELVGLAAADRRRIGGYSLGMRQRLALAVAMLGDPQVLVLDEPANGLGPEGIVWMRQLLRDLAALGRTVLVSSHVLTETQQLVDHVVIIDDGHLLYQGPVDALGALLRDQVAAIVGLLVLLFVAEPIVTRIPALQDWTVFLPGPSAGALTGITLTDQDFLQPWQGALTSPEPAARRPGRQTATGRSARHHSSMPSLSRTARRPSAVSARTASCAITQYAPRQ
jgi:hypothetical protein